MSNGPPMACDSTCTGLAWFIEHNRSLQIGSCICAIGRSHPNEDNEPNSWRCPLPLSVANSPVIPRRKGSSLRMSVTTELASSLGGSHASKKLQRSNYFSAAVAYWKIDESDIGKAVSSNKAIIVGLYKRERICFNQEMGQPFPDGHEANQNAWSTHIKWSFWDWWWLGHWCSSCRFRRLF